MATDISAERWQLHQLIDSLPPEQVRSALGYLSYLSADPMLLSLLTAPPDDEPYTDEQRQHDSEAEASIARGEGIAHEEVVREFGL